MKKPTHKIYRTTNWPAYNRALMSRGNIAIWFDSATQWYAPSKGKQGRNQTYSDAAIQCYLMMKSLFRLSLRMFKGFVAWIGQHAPDYSTLCRRCNWILNLKSLINKSIKLEESELNMYLVA